MLSMGGSYMIGVLIGLYLLLAFGIFGWFGQMTPAQVPLNVYGHLWETQATTFRGRIDADAIV